MTDHLSSAELRQPSPIILNDAIRSPLGRHESLRQWNVVRGDYRKELGINNDAAASLQAATTPPTRVLEVELPQISSVITVVKRRAITVGDLLDAVMAELSKTPPEALATEVGRTNRQLRVAKAYGRRTAWLDLEEDSPTLLLDFLENKVVFAGFRVRSNGRLEFQTSSPEMR